MNERFMQFAEVLFRGNVDAVAAARDAIERPAAFIERHAADLGYVRPKPGWMPDPWNLLLDVATVRGWVWEIDWRTASDEVVAVVRGLPPAASLNVDWDRLADTHADADTETFLALLARAVAQVGEALVCLDRGSDSYPLALLVPNSLAEARRLAAEIGGRVNEFAV